LAQKWRKGDEKEHEKERKRLTLNDTIREGLEIFGTVGKFVRRIIIIAEKFE
jgi:hypothetical protein